MWFVYWLKCADGKIYTGCTGNLEERLLRHQNGHVSYTSSRLPVKLIGYTAFADKYRAFDFEKYLLPVLDKFSGTQT